MMKAIGSPGHVRTHKSDELKERLSEIHRKRWGAPEGYCTVRGIHIPFEHRDPVRYWSDWLANAAGEEAAQSFILDLKARDWAGIQRIRELMDQKKLIGRNRKAISRLQWEAHHAN